MDFGEKEKQKKNVDDFDFNKGIKGKLKEFSEKKQINNDDLPNNKINNPNFRMKSEEKRKVKIKNKNIQILDNNINNNIKKMKLIIKISKK